jgi:hypothetical protein
MREDIANGVWRVIAAQGSSEGKLGVHVGAFVREAAPLPVVEVPDGWRYMSTADNKKFGLVADASLLKIELNTHVPTPDPICLRLSNLKLEWVIL